MKTIFTISLMFIALASYAQSNLNCHNLYVSLSNDGSQIYFSSDRHNPGGNFEIYRSDLDGQSNLERLTNTASNNLYPHESPDGSKIVWQSGDYGMNSEIWIMDVDGTMQTQLTSNSGHDGFPNFSPNGQKIVFEAWDNDAYPEIFTMDVSGNNRAQITMVSGAYWQSAPIYDPTGNYIYVSMGLNADNHYTRMDLDGANWVDITPPNTFGIAEGGLSFSPDGTKIIFLTTEFTGYNNGSDIIIADLDGSNWSQITTSSGGEYFYYPVWDANNDVYYSYNSTGTSNWSINRMTTAGTNDVMLSNCSGAGLKEESLPIVEVYPNPAMNNLFIKCDEMDFVEIYDVKGLKVLSASNSILNVETLKKGMYTVVVYGQDQRIIDHLSFIKE